MKLRLTVRGRSGAQAKALRYLDISDIILDRKSVEWVCAAIAVERATAPVDGPPAVAPPAEAAGAASDDAGSAAAVPGTPERAEAEDSEPRPIFTPSAPLLRDDAVVAVGSSAGASSLRTLRMDGCILKAGSLEVLGPAIRHSQIQNLSIRRNRISNLGAVAVAVMMKDYPDAAATGPGRVASSLSSSVAATPEKSTSALPPARDSTVSSAAMSREESQDSIATAPPRGESSAVQPPPRHPALSGQGTPTPASRALSRIDTAARREQERGTSLAITRQVKMMENVETVGHLQTLDLKGNEIRVSCTRFPGPPLLG